MESFSVLIAEPAAPGRGRFIDALKARGWGVDVANNMQDTMELVGRNTYNVAIVSMSIPGMDGPETIAEIKKVQPDIIIFAAAEQKKDALKSLPQKGACLFLRGSVDITEAEEVVDSGIPACFLKPFDVEMFLGKIQEIVQRRSEEKRLHEIRSSRILFVEDSETIRKTTEYILASEGFSVKTASTLEEAVKLIESETFNMVISDLSLGTSSGLSLIDHVRKKDSSTVFLIMTGRASMETALEAIKKDVDEYILKPVEPQDLVRKVKSYLDKQRMLKEKEALMRQLKDTNTKLLQLIKTDELTGVFNRRYLFEQLYHEIQRAKRQKKPLCLMMCDVDGFKKYNDTYGHIEGDILLKEIAGLLQTSVREYVDQVFRYGGDEFAITVPEVSRREALEIAGRVVKSVRKSMKNKGISLSIGLAFFNPKSKKLLLNDFIRDADKNLYKAKKLGGNRAAA